MKRISDLKDVQLFVLDMDGTIYHENTLIPGTLEFFDKIKTLGKDFAFMTNNSSKSKTAYLEKLNKLGIKATPKNIISSVSVTIDYLQQHYPPQSKIYLIGTDSFKEEIIQNGFQVVAPFYREEDIAVCVLGFDTELTYSKIEGGCYYISRGYDYIATNCDIRCPVRDNKFIPDCGSMAQMIEAATGRLPLFLGKPEAAIVNTASKEFGVPISNILCVGDRLYTDIAVGIKSGAKSALVLTGESTVEDLEDTPFKPDYVFPSIKELSEAI